MEVAKAAAYRAISTALTTGTPPWGESAFLHQAPAKHPRPYVVFLKVGGGEANDRIIQDAEHLYEVKAVADDAATALMCAGEISNRLNDKGRYDVDAGETPLDGGAEWWILTTTEETDIDLMELTPAGERLYHMGADYRFRMERK